MPKITEVDLPSIKKDFIKRYKLKNDGSALIVIDCRSIAETQEWILQYLSGLNDLDLSVLVLGRETISVTGDAVLISDKDECEEALEAGDVVVITDVSGANLKKVWQAGGVPVCVDNEFVTDYNPIKETGNAFVAPTGSVWGYFAATVRAVETYGFPYDWRHLLDSCRKSGE